MEKKVLLINYAGYWLTTESFIPDASLATLAGVLLHNDIPVEILDFQATGDVGKVMDYENFDHAQNIVKHLENGTEISQELLEKYKDQRERGQDLFIEEKIEEILEKIKNENVGTVGFKLWVGNGLSRSVKIAKAIKEAYPHVKVVAGGPAVHLAGKHFMIYTDIFDHVVMYEGENAIVQIAKGEEIIENSIDEIVRRKGKNILNCDLDDLPHPVYSKEVYPSIDSLYKYRMIDDSRGCFNKCAFCSHHEISGHGTRRKNVSRVVDEIEKQYREDDIKHFRLTGSNPPWESIIGIAKEVIRREIKISWSAFSSFNNTNKDDFPLLAESGFKSIFFGLESGDKTILENVMFKDNVGDEHIVATCRAAMEHGIFIILSTIVPAPFETEMSKKRTYNLLKKIFKFRQHGSVCVRPPMILKGSAWFDNPGKFTFQFDKDVDESKYLVGLLEFDANHLLPRSMMKPLPYSYSGRTCTEAFLESYQFQKKVEKLGMSINADDSTFLLGNLSGMTPEEFQKVTARDIVVGGEDHLKSTISKRNNGPSIPVSKSFERYLNV